MPPPNLDPKVFASLLHYYREKRLCYQKHYFDRQARRSHFWERFTRTAPVLFFFLSIIAALGHFGVEVLVPGEGGPAGEQAELFDTADLILLMMAACFPVVGVAVRTLHTAHEFSRNALRFESTAGELDQLASELEGKSDPQAKLEALHRVEDSLRAERREWMRLMKEVKWFG